MRSMLSLCLVLLYLSAGTTALSQNNPADEPPCPDEKSVASIIQGLLNDQDRIAARNKFQELFTNRSEDYCFDEQQFNQLGYNLLYESRPEDAVAVFEMSVTVYPESANAHNSLGDGYVHAGNREKAISHLEKALALDPENPNFLWSLRTVDQNLSDLAGEIRLPWRYSAGENTELQGEYCGQKPPGLVGEVFAPGLVSTGPAFEFGPTFSPDGKQMYFRRRGVGGGFLVSHWKADGWTAPEPVPDLPRAFEPHITPDGTRMYFGRGPEIWYCDRTATGWGDPVRHGLGMFATTTTDKTIYLTDITQEWAATIARQRLVDGQYTPMEKISETMNGPGYGAHPCIAPDESFLIFDARPPEDEYGDSDFLICFRQADGTWNEPQLIAEMNSAGENICASLSPDGRYLFYTNCRDIYWISSEILQRYRDR